MGPNRWTSLLCGFVIGNLANPLKRLKKVVPRIYAEGRRQGRSFFRSNRPKETPSVRVPVGLLSPGAIWRKLFLTGLLPATPVGNGGVKGSYPRMATFLILAAKHCRQAEPAPGKAGRFHLPEGHDT